VVIFLPQILILFFFILLLEDFGYMTRAAFLMDRIMSGVGLNGRAFIPLLSSFACAIPGIMAARTIAHPMDRMITILIAPLMTCSARLPVYTPADRRLHSQHRGLGRRLAGAWSCSACTRPASSARWWAGLLRLTMLRGSRQPLLMELPSYKWPNPANVLLGLLDRAKAFHAPDRARSL
jgi:ferrous iron transport protein B